MANLTLGESLENVYRALAADTVESIATGGTLTTLLDSTLIGRYSDGDFLNGVIFDSVTHQFSQITNYQDNNGGSSTFTFGAIATAPVNGDSYSAIKSTQFPLQTMIKIFNDALHDLDRIPITDVSLTVQANALSYTLPVAIKDKPIVKIQIQSQLVDYYDDVGDWYPDNKAPGAANLLFFRSYYPVGRIIKIWYLDIHPQVSIYSDPIAESLYPELVRRAVEAAAIEWRVRKTKRGDTNMLAELQEARALLQDAILRYPPIIPEKKANFLNLSSANVRR